MTLQDITRKLLTANAENLETTLDDIRVGLNSDAALAIKFLNSLVSINRTFGLEWGLIFGFEGDFISVHSHSSSHSRSGQFILSIDKLIELSSQGLDIDIRNTYGNTALSVAASNGYAKAWKKLIAAGADPNIMGSKGRTPLQIAKEDNPEAFEGII